MSSNGVGSLDAATRSFVENLLSQQRDLTIATVRPDGYPQVDTVSYANEGLSLYFATGRYSQKVRNLRSCGKASVTVDAPNVEWTRIRGLWMRGEAVVLSVDSDESRRAFERLAHKFAEIARFPPQPEPAAIAFVRFVPEVISVLDVSQGVGHSEVTDVKPADDSE